LKKLERGEQLGLILFAVMTAVTYATFVFIQPLPPDAEIPLLMSPNTVVAKGLASDIYLSGTVVTVPFETFEALNENFSEQKIITVSRSSIITVHYLGKDKDGFTYHAIQEYSYSMGIDTDTIRIEGNTLKYHLGDDGLTIKALIILVEVVVALAILVVGFWPRLKALRDR
jgi:hypothetical protein